MGCKVESILGVGCRMEQKINPQYCAGQVQINLDSPDSVDPLTIDLGGGMDSFLEAQLNYARKLTGCSKQPELIELVMGSIRTYGTDKLKQQMGIR